MNRIDALERLASGSQHERLVAARTLLVKATATDLPVLRRALRSERVPWIRSALETAITAAAVRPRDRDDTAVVPLASDEALANEIYGRAMEELTDRFVHELRPLLGLARLHGKREFPDFETSDTASALKQMQELLRAIDMLGRAAAVPKIRQCDIASLVRDASTSCVAELTGLGRSIGTLAFDGPEPLLVATDADLLCLAMKNGVKNALEASATSAEPVIVSWGGSRDEFWISVLDFGVGLSMESSSLFSIGTTNKAGHLGMGLAIAQRAAITLGGTVSLDSRPDGSTQFEIKCPRLEA